MRVLCLLQKLELDRFMLYAHGPDLCRESDLRHAMANCFEALIGEPNERGAERSAAFDLTGIHFRTRSDPVWSKESSPAGSVNPDTILSLIRLLSHVLPSCDLLNQNSSSSDLKFHMKWVKKQKFGDKTLLLGD